MRDAFNKHRRDKLRLELEDKEAIEREIRDSRVRPLGDPTLSAIDVKWLNCAPEWLLKLPRQLP